MTPCSRCRRLSSPARSRPSSRSAAWISFLAIHCLFEVWTTSRMRKNTTNPQSAMIREGMRGEDHQQNHVFSYLSPEMRVRPDHPLRTIRAMVDEVLSRLSRRFDSMYAKVGRPSIAPEKLLRAQLLQMLYSIRSERLLMEEMDYNLLFPGSWG